MSGAGCRVSGVGCRVQGAGLRFSGVGCGVKGPPVLLFFGREQLLAANETISLSCS